MENFLAVRDKSWLERGKINTAYNEWRNPAATPQDLQSKTIYETIRGLWDVHRKQSAKRYLNGHWLIIMQIHVISVT